MGPLGSKKLTMAIGHKVRGVDITEKLLKDIRRMIRQGVPASKVAVKTHLTDVDIRMYAKEYGRNLLQRLNENEGCRTRKATADELEAVKHITGNVLCIYGENQASYMSER